MQEKDIKLFDRAIHHLKEILWDLKNERDEFHNKIDKLSADHDNATNKLMNKAKETLDEVQELLDDLYNGRNGKDIIQPPLPPENPTRPSERQNDAT